MSERTHLLVQQWLQQAGLSADALQQLANEYPYFSAAQLLLFQQQDGRAADYAAQKKKAALHVYNPMLLEESAKTLHFPFEVDIAPNSNVNEINTTATEIATYEPAPIEEKEIKAFEADPAENGNSAQTESETTIDDADAQPVAMDAGEEATLPEITITETAEAERPPVGHSVADALPPTPEISFEPYHTVDYFASQGIRLSQAEAGNDRMGKQLKSFTEWLKTMKKLPATAITQNTDAPGERKVANLAEHSLQKADVVTEAMAEVWLKQGNKEKASEVYNKLSLQNPSKRAYFAAKIESLKKPS